MTLLLPVASSHLGNVASFQSDGSEMDPCVTQNVLRQGVGAAGGLLCVAALHMLSCKIWQQSL